MKRKRTVLIESHALNASETETCACWPLGLRVLTCLLHAAMRTRQTRTHARRHECSRSPACRCTPTRPNALSHAHAPYALTALCERGRSCASVACSAVRRPQEAPCNHALTTTSPIAPRLLSAHHWSAHAPAHADAGIRSVRSCRRRALELRQAKSEAWRAVMIGHLGTAVVRSGAMRCGAHITRIGIFAGDCWRGGRSASLRRGSAWNVFCPHPD